MKQEPSFEVTRDSADSNWEELDRVFLLLAWLSGLLTCISLLYAVSQAIGGIQQARVHHIPMKQIWHSVNHYWDEIRTGTLSVHRAACVWHLSRATNAFICALCGLSSTSSARYYRRRASELRRSYAGTLTPKQTIDLNRASGAQATPNGVQWLQEPTGCSLSVELGALESACRRGLVVYCMAAAYVASAAGVGGHLALRHAHVYQIPMRTLWDCYLGLGGKLADGTVSLAEVICVKYLSQGVHGAALLGITLTAAWLTIRAKHFLGKLRALEAMALVAESSSSQPTALGD